MERSAGPPLKATKQPDTQFRLNEAQRAKLRPFVDPNAVEQLLAWTPPEWRDRLLTGFAAATPRADGYLLAVPDPALQAMIDHAWQPFWDQLPEEVLADSSMDAYPGRRLAAERRHKGAT